MDVDQFETQFTVGSTAPLQARANLLNAVAWVVGVAAFIMALAAPAIAWRVWTWAW